MGEQVCKSDGDPTTAKWMAIGEAPWKDEAREGKGFVGRSGKMLWATASKQDMRREDCFVTNVTQSMPEGSGGSPTMAQIHDESERFYSEVASFQGSVILCLGKISFERITGWKGIQRHRGYCFRPQDCRNVEQRQRFVSEYKTSRRCPTCKDRFKRIAELTKAGICARPPELCPECLGSGWKYRKGDERIIWKKVGTPVKLGPNVKWIVPSLHPSAVMRTGFKTIPHFKADVRRAARLAYDDSGVITSPATPDTFTVEAVKRVTIDIETPMDSRVIDRAGMAWQDSFWDDVAWTECWGTGTLAEEVFHLQIKEVLANPQVEKAFHNAAFDVPRLADAGCPLQGDIFDTMWAAQMLRPDLPKGLYSVAPLYLDVMHWKHLSESDPELYNLMDAYVQHKLSTPLEERLIATEQMPSFRRFMKCLPHLMDLTRYGMKVDTEYLKRWVSEQEQGLAEAVAEWPFPEVNFGSPKQLQNLFYGRFKLPVQRSKHGGVTCDETAIRALRKRDNPKDVQHALELLLRIRESRRNVSYYGDVLIGEDGYVHPDYLPQDKEQTLGGGSKTGRLQPRNPNMANQHGDARKMYVPDEPDQRIVSRDLQQAEAWIECALSRDSKLQRALEDGLHDYIQAALKVDRVRAKNVWYGTGRLASARTLTITLNKEGYPTTIAESQEMQDKLHQTFPDWASWRFRTIEEAEAKRYVREPLGRRYYFSGRGNGPAIVGFIPQACVGSAFQEMMPEIAEDASKLGGRLWNLLHDQFFTIVPDGRESQASLLMARVMEQEIDAIAPGFKFNTDAQIGQPGESWGAMDERYKS